MVIITGAIEQQRFAPKCSYNTSGGGINAGFGGVSIVILMYQQHQLFQRGFVSMVVWSVHKAIHPGRAIAKMLVWWLEDESNSHTKDSGGRMLKSIDGALGGYDDMVGWWLWNWRWLLCYFGSYQRHACPTFCIATNFKHPEHFIIPSTRFTSFSPCRPSALSQTDTLALCLFHPMLDIVVHGSTLIRVDAHQQKQWGESTSSSASL